MTLQLTLPGDLERRLHQEAERQGLPPDAVTLKLLDEHLPRGERVLATRLSDGRSWVSKRPDRCGGDACIRETRIPVWAVVNYRRLQASDAKILEAYPSLTPSDLEAAWEYAAANPEEIDRAIRENEEGKAGFVE